jgi:hypothetical protein
MSETTGIPIGRAVAAWRSDVVLSVPIVLFDEILGLSGIDSLSRNPWPPGIAEKYAGVMG